MPERMSLADAWHMPVKHTQALLLPGVFRKQQSPRALGMHFGCFTSSRRVLSCSREGFCSAQSQGSTAATPSQPGEPLICSFCIPLLSCS